MNKKMVVGVGTAALMLLPALAFADTASDLQTQIQALLQQVKSLQQQLFSLQGSSTHDWSGWTNSTSTPWTKPGGGDRGQRPCVSIARTITQGTQGDDVKEIQQMLANDSDTGFHGTPTGFFGPMTAEAMKKFQMKFGIASSSTGTVGPATRRFFDESCSNGLGNSGSTNTGMPKPFGGMGGSGQGPMGGMMIQGMSGVTGTITANNGSSITIQTDGGSKTVLITGTTTITILSASSTAGSTGGVADLTVGLKAGAFGIMNADGSIIANIIKAGTFIHPNNMGGIMPQMGGEHMGGPGMMSGNGEDNQGGGGQGGNGGSKPPIPWWMPQSVQPQGNN